MSRPPPNVPRGAPPAARFHPYVEVRSPISPLTSARDRRASSKAGVTRERALAFAPLRCVSLWLRAPRCWVQGGLCCADDKTNGAVKQQHVAECGVIEAWERGEKHAKKLAAWLVPTCRKPVAGDCSPWTSILPGFTHGGLETSQASTLSRRLGPSSGWWAMAGVFLSKRARARALELPRFLALPPGPIAARHAGITPSRTCGHKTLAGRPIPRGVHIRAPNAAGGH